MSISLENFKLGNFERKKKCNRETYIDKILTFLKSNQRAYKVEEIAEMLKINTNTIRHALRTLKDENEVIHKIPYFAYKK